jgi:hypothetical protein
MPYHHISLLLHYALSSIPFLTLFASITITISLNFSLTFSSPSPPPLPLHYYTTLDALKYTSIVGLAGLVYTVCFMGLRLFDGSYASGGQFFNAIESTMR